MKTSSISEIKKALLVLDNFQVVELCLRLAKYKKENKARYKFVKAICNTEK